MQPKAQSVTLAGAPQPVRGAYVPEAGGAAGLDAAESARFERDGWVGSFPLLTQEGVARLCAVRNQVILSFTPPDQLAQAADPQAFERRPWFKSLHAYVPQYYDVACHPAIVGRVASVLGPDVIAWGLTVIVSRPGTVHRWHLDIEHRRWHGVSVYLGLENIDLDSTLKLITGSQRMPGRPQAYGVTDDASALAAVRSRELESGLVKVSIAPGEFFLFAGRLWHASHNTGTRERVSMIIHYCRPDARVEVPLNFDEPIRWHASRPPCVLVSGQDRHGVNRLVGRPVLDAPA